MKYKCNWYIFNTGVLTGGIDPHELLDSERSQECKDLKIFLNLPSTLLWVLVILQF